MKSTTILTILCCACAFAADKKSPQGRGEDDAVAVTATLLNPDQVKQAVGSDFNNDYMVIEVSISPKGGKPYQVRPDDFILRSESSGEHTGPFTSATQIAGSSTLEVQRQYGNRENADSPRPLTGTKLQMKTDDKVDPALGPLKQKMLADQTTTSPVTGLLFFPFGKEKPKNLILSYKTPASHIRISFK
jgi:hypothetical protein